MSVRIVHGDCREVMAAMEPESIDAICTDPPYGLEFMGRDWDKLDGGLPQEAQWKGRRGKGGGGVNKPDPNWKKFENTPRVNYGGKPQAFKRCAKCGKRSFSGSPCTCPDPEWVVEYPSGPPSSSIRMQRWHETWAREAFRVLKPGGHLVAFGGTRTYHRLTCAIEDAGFEIRDAIGMPTTEPGLGLYAFVHGQGFPKNTDVEREIAVKTCALPGRHFKRTLPKEEDRLPDDHICPMTPESEPWQGWGSAAKPAWEPIVLARKPLRGGIAGNVMRYGTGGLNVDGCRIEGPVLDSDKRRSSPGPTGAANVYEGGYRGNERPNQRDDSTRHNAGGRWPANVVLRHIPCDENGEGGCREVGVRRVKQNGGNNHTKYLGNGYGEGYGAMDSWPGYASPDGTETVAAWECAPGCPVAELDRQSGERRPGERPANRSNGVLKFGGQNARPSHDTETLRGDRVVLDAGGASRFFFCAKSSRSERNKGLEGMPERAVDRYGECGQGPTPQQTPRVTRSEGNHHPTVKPLDLMQWLVRLVTPPGGTVLDPFCGSGTTLIAADRQGFDAIGIEQDAEYCLIAERRTRGDAPLFADVEVS